MKIYSVYFNHKESRKYQYFVDTLGESLRINMSDVEFHAVRIPAPENKIHIPFKQICCHEKLKKWNEILQNEDEAILFLDSDTVVIEPLKIITDCDIAITVRPIETHKMNGGVLYVMPNDRTRMFFRQWLSFDEMQIENPSFLLENQKKCFGYNQASFFGALELSPDLKIEEWKCSEMNLCWGVWNELCNSTKILHLNGRMQNAIFERGFDVPEFMRPIIHEWKKYFRGDL